MKVLDLFCGAGLFSAGFKDAGFQIGWGVDNDKKVLILIQTYHFMNVQLQDFPYIQVAIYSRILESMGLKVIDFLYVNYYNMIVIKKTFTDKFYEKLDKFLESFRSNIIENNYEPSKNPPCKLCEFKIICEALG